MDTALNSLSRMVTVFLTGFTLVLLTSLVVTIGPERGTTITLITAAALALPAGAASAMTIRRSLTHALKLPRLDTVMITVTAVELLAAGLAVISGRDSLAVTLLALASGSVAGLTAHKAMLLARPPWLPPVLGAGSLGGVLTFTGLGIDAITVSAVALILWAAGIVAVHAAADVDESTEVDRRALIDA